MELFEKKDNLENATLKSQYLILLKSEMKFNERHFKRKIRAIIEMKKNEQGLVEIDIKINNKESILKTIKETRPNQGRNSVTLVRVKKELNDLNKVKERINVDIAQAEENTKQDEEIYVQTKKKIRKVWFSKSKNI